MIKKYIPAFITALVWGSTFVASKQVLDVGVSPITLMTMRFALAYVLLLSINRERLQFERNKTELKIFLTGVCGGSVYFLLEYMALQRTTAVNVGLICATVPVISAAIELVLRRELPSLRYVVGSLVAFFGVLLLVTDGKLLIDIFPTGDLLAMACAIMWAIYSVVLGRIGKSLKEVVVERRMMFYSLVTILPIAIIIFDNSELEAMTSSAKVVGSIFYLGAIASAGCLWLWNVSVNKIGVVRTNNFLYLLPVVSLITSALLMQGEVTGITICATALIVAGIVVADR